MFFFICLSFFYSCIGPYPCLYARNAWKCDWNSRGWQRTTGGHDHHHHYQHIIMLPGTVVMFIMSSQTVVVGYRVGRQSSWFKCCHGRWLWVFKNRLCYATCVVESYHINTQSSPRALLHSLVNTLTKRMIIPTKDLSKRFPKLLLTWTRVHCSNNVHRHVTVYWHGAEMGMWNRELLLDETIFCGSKKNISPSSPTSE